MPPEAVTVAVPSLPPLQLTSVPEIEEVIAVGSVNVTLTVKGQLLASKISNV